MNLFELNNEHRVIIQPEAYALEPFKKIWDRDKTKDKSVAIAELAYIYYTCDFKSDFRTISDIQKRSEEIKKYLGFPKGHTIDNVVKVAMDFYLDKSSTVTMLLLDDIYISIDKLREYFRGVDLLEYDDKGKPVHDVTKLTRSIESVAKIIESLKLLEDKVRGEMIDKGLRAGRKKGMYEDA